jgi:putative intracellular protease/amidase
VLQAYAQALLRNTRGVSDPLRYVSEGLRARTLRDARLLGIDVKVMQPQPVTHCARASFADAFGVDETTQLKIEKWLDTWTFSTSNVFTVGQEWQVEGWISAQSDFECHRVKA